MPFAALKSWGTTSGDSSHFKTGTLKFCKCPTCKKSCVPSLLECQVLASANLKMGAVLGCVNAGQMLTNTHQAYTVQMLILSKADRSTVNELKCHYLELQYRK